MSLDQAFIKAFAEPPTAAPRRDRVATPISATLVREEPHSLPAPIDEPAATAVPHLARRQTLGTKAAARLSTFKPAVLSQRVQPAIELDELAWPKPCAELLARARRGWDRFAKRLVQSPGEKCFALTSCVRGEGRTTTVLTVARHLAAQGLACVVVDADFENPGVSHALDVAPQAGWADVVGGELPLNEALIGAPGDGVTLMPWHGHGPLSPAPTNLTRVASCFETLRAHFDVVLIDAPPLLNDAALATLSRLAEPMHLDAMYLVYDARYTTSQQLQDACERLHDAGLAAAGAIENFSGTPAASERGLRDRLPKFVGRVLATHG